MNRAYISLNVNRQEHRRLNEGQRRHYESLLKEATNNGVKIEFPEGGTDEKRRLLKKYFPERFGESMHDCIDKMQPLDVGVCFRDVIMHPEGYLRNEQYRTDKDKYNQEIDNSMIDEKSKGSDLEILVQIEEKIRKKVLSMSNEKLEEEYKKITEGTNRYLESLKRKERDVEIRGLNLEIDAMRFYGAYSSTLSTYGFAKEALRKGTPKQLKVRVNNKDKFGRGYTMIDTKEIFLDAARRVAILEEYSKRITTK